MNSEIEGLKAQQAELEARIKAAEKKVRDADLATVKELCKKHGFTHGMLKSSLAAGRNRKSKFDNSNS